MRIEAVERIAGELPRQLADDLIGYTRSVASTLPVIIREAGVQRTDWLADQIVFVAAIKKLYSICTSSYWIVENAVRALRGDATQIRIGSLVLSRRSDEFRRLQRLLVEFTKIAEEQDLQRFLDNPSYSEIARQLSHER